MTQNYNYSKDTGYVNIHGDNIEVFVCDKTGRILVPIDEVKKMGFRLYRKNQYSRFLIDDNQFRQEFDLFMLSTAQNYMLERKIAFKENDILESINKCKQLLFSKGVENINSQEQRNGSYQNNFIRSHKFEATGDDINIKVTADLREPSALTLQNLEKERFQKNFTQNVSSTSSTHSNNVKNSKQNQQASLNNSFEKVFKSDNYKNVQKNNLPFKSGLTSKKQFDKKNGNLESQKGEKQTQEKLLQVEFNSPEHTVIITFVEKPHICWVQDLDQSEIVLDIDSKIKDEDLQSNKYVKHALNKIYLAQDDGCWFRCKIIKFKPLSVFFVDYGNISQVKEVKEVSEELASIPCQATKIVFRNSEYVGEIGKTVRIRIKERFSNGSYAVDVIGDLSEAEEKKPTLDTFSPEVKKNGTFHTKPQPLCKLENGQRVLIVSQNDGSLALRTKECYDKLKQIGKDLGAIEVVSLDKVECGQQVLYSRTNRLERASVVSVQGDKVELELLDFWEKIKADISSLKNTNETLSREPITYIVTPKVQGFNANCETLIKELITTKAKLSVVLSDAGFDLKLGEELIFDKFKARESDKPMLDKFKRFEPKKGIDDYMLMCYHNSENLTLVHIETFNENIEALIKTETDDAEPHNPVIGEVCLGSYTDSWSRCVVLDENNSRFEVQFIDFGNKEYLNSHQLRKLTDDVKDVPIIGITCKLIGLPTIENIEDLLKEKIIEGESYEVNLKKYNGAAYEIEIPTIYKELTA